MSFYCHAQSRQARYLNIFSPGKASSPDHILNAHKDVAKSLTEAGLTGTDFIFIKELINAKDFQSNNVSYRCCFEFSSTLFLSRNTKNKLRFRSIFSRPIPFGAEGTKRH